MIFVFTFYLCSFFIFQPLSKKIPENPKYKNVRSTIDTGKKSVSIGTTHNVSEASVSMVDLAQEILVNNKTLGQNT